ncbi:DUF6479 family protein [Streptomyces sp. NBC_00989]|uniref:DUF6479 family protein n=1 Tax=Streptomyces sp. NBC_00989 TaxID=2903705 RepID=UPI0038700672|nr:DUF6479 family protein [Streptomyces sp. NBC_00989]
MMITENEHVDLAASGAAMGLVVAFAGGLVIVALLVWSVRLGIKVRQREPAPPRPDEQPRLPESGAVREVREQREPDEVPRTPDGERLLPHNLRHSGSRRSENQERPRWDERSGDS